jgi:hypothetical protein
MAKPSYDWYFGEWLRATGKRQADIVRDLDWNKAKVSLMVSGKQQYERESVNELSQYFQIMPFELLMPPEEAFAMRRLRHEIARLAHSESAPMDGTIKKVSNG